VPTLNILVKNMAENISPDECLFGTSFGEELKKTTTMVKSAKDLVKAHHCWYSERCSNPSSPNCM
ncbi:hypothetical protein X777_10504, partial [Ooceraea biroi]